MLKTTSKPLCDYLLCGLQDLCQFGIISINLLPLVFPNNRIDCFQINLPVASTTVGASWVRGICRSVVARVHFVSFADSMCCAGLPQ